MADLKFGIGRILSLDQKAENQQERNILLPYVLPYHTLPVYYNPVLGRVVSLAYPCLSYGLRRPANAYQRTCETQNEESDNFKRPTQVLCSPKKDRTQRIITNYEEATTRNKQTGSLDSNSGDSSAASLGNKTRKGGRKCRSWSRAVFSNLQRKGLEKRFQLQKYITKPDRKLLAAALGLSDSQVKVWFQNRRMKWRHFEEKAPPPKQTSTEDASR